MTAYPLETTGPFPLMMERLPDWPTVLIGTLRSERGPYARFAVSPLELELARIDVLAYHYARLLPQLVTRFW